MIENYKASRITVRGNVVYEADRQFVVVVCFLFVVVVLSVQ